jgi:AcrR family transcriptional regulator
VRRDAQQNAHAIVAAAVALFAERPDASVSDVAAAAGVTRQTVYAHFPARERLLEAAVDHGLAQAVAAIDAAEPDRGPADEALTRLVGAAWQIIERYHRVVAAAESALGTEIMRERHRPVLDRVAALLERGRREGVFDQALPAPWLLATWIALQHAAAREVAAGRMTPRAAERALLTTLPRAFRME